MEAPPPAWKRWCVVAMVVALLAQMLVAMLLSAKDDTPTFDEPAHIGAGLAWYRYRDLNFDPDHPPLTMLLATLPLRLEKLKLPPDQSPDHIDEYSFGLQAMYRLNGTKGPHILWLARLPMIGLTLLFALCIFGFARDLFGARGGLVSLALASAYPDMITHGRFVDTDLAVAGFLLVTSWFLWKAMRGSAWWFLAASFAFGFALTSKSIALFFLPAMLFLVLVAHLVRSHRSSKSVPRRISEAVALGAMFVGIGIGVIWSLYVAVDPAVRWERPVPPRPHRLLDTVTERLPVPEPYRAGLFIRIDDNRYRRPAFLFGRSYRGGRRLFYPALLAVKTPLGTMALWLAGLAVIVWSRRRWELLAFLALAPLAYLGVAIMSQINIGVRHILPVPLSILVAAGAVTLVRKRAALVATVALVAFAMVSTWHVFPSYAAYVNEAFGGPNRAYKIMADSNLDWGQDLKRLHDFMQAHYPDEPFAVWYFGSTPISAYGFSPAQAWHGMRSPHPNLVAVSASQEDYQPAAFSEIAAAAGPPIAQIGHSILLFRLPA